METKRRMTFNNLAVLIIAASLTTLTACSGASMLKTPLTLEAIEDGTITVESDGGIVTYTIDGGKKQTISAGTEKDIAVTAGQKVAFYCYNFRAGQITCSADCYIYGNIMSLVSSYDFASAKELTEVGCFYGLFYKNTHIKNAPNKDLLLPATGLTESCYKSMFEDCTGLTAAPVLPATTLADWCYSSMFMNCTGLTAALELPATTLAGGCYKSMFSGCTGLTAAPALPATTLAESCYSSMFMNCTGLTAAPELPATTLTNDCYGYMFYGCTGLTAAPVLPATTLAEGCYYAMFRNCTNLNNVTCLATEYSYFTTPDNSKKSNTQDWLSGVAKTGTFHKDPWMYSWPKGSSGIPEGWTVRDVE